MFNLPIEAMYGITQKMRDINIPILAKRYDIEYDDVLSIANLSFMKSTKTFNPMKGFRFITWYYNCLVNEVRYHARGYNRAKGLYYTTVRENGVPQSRYIQYGTCMSLEKPILSGDDKISLKDIIEDDKDKDIENIGYKEIYNKFEEEMNKHTFRALPLYLNGYTQIEIGDILNISQSYAGRLMKKEMLTVTKALLSQGIDRQDLIDAVSLHGHPLKKYRNEKAYLWS